ncbi:MAG: glycine cleavage system protein H [Candidatus Thorarchaeota archaeon]
MVKVVDLKRRHAVTSSGDYIMVTYEGFDFPEDLFYTDDQVWISKLDDGKVRLGFTSFGMSLAGMIKFVRLRPAGKKIAVGRSIGTLESGKWTGPIKSPVSGTITEVNEALKDNPSLLNDDAYGAGWIAVIEPDDFEGEKGALQGADGLEDWVKAQYAEKKTE